ncbi:MAG: hypothetical protein M3Y55_18845, partial [Pseudomonadota bacterium]|nr:hypothetical protein [Pseudomonadota bacterium]
AMVPPKSTLQLGGSALQQHLSPGARERADFAAKEQAGITREGVQILRTVRRQMMRAMFIRTEKGRAVANDYLLWLLLRRQLVMNEHVMTLGGRGLGRDDDVIPISIIKSAIEQENAIPAAAIWDSAIAELREHPAMAEADVVAAFRAFRQAPASFKHLAAAAIAAMTLARSMNAEGYLIPLHDELAHQAGYGFEPSLRALWEPTDAFVELLPKANRLALAEPHVDRMAFRTWGNLKASELVGQVTRALLRAKTFVHPMLAFAPIGSVAIEPTIQEAAE